MENYPIAKLYAVVQGDDQVVMWECILLSLAGMKFQLMSFHPWWHWDLCRNVSVLSIAVVWKTLWGYDLTNGAGIEGEQKRTQHWALWDTSGESAWCRCRSSPWHLKWPFLIVGSKPPWCCNTNSKTWRMDRRGLWLAVLIVAERSRMDENLADQSAWSSTVTATSMDCADLNPKLGRILEVVLCKKMRPLVVYSMLKDFWKK